MIRRITAIMILMALLVPGCARKLSIPQIPMPTVEFDWPAGTVLESRNKDEKLNKSPGFQNHLAMYVGNGVVVESQEDQNGVVKTPFSVYKARAYEWTPLFPVQEAVGKKAAAKSLTLVGIPYKELSSIYHFSRSPVNGLNCVSVIRVSYEDATNTQMPKLKIPDDIHRYYEGMFTKVLPFYAAPKPKLQEPAKKAA